MSKNMRRNRRGIMAISVGWLFADLLLAVAMLFLIANTVAPVRPLATPTPTVVPTPTLVPTPTPTPNINALLLDRDRVRLKLEGIDPDKVSAGDPGAINDLKQKIQAQVTAQGLQDRRAGIAIASGGADNSSDIQINRGINVATEVYNVLDMLGGQKFVFCKTVHYDPLFTLKENSTVIVIDTYLFNKSAGGCDKIA